jgi:hypothetical protein
MQNKHNKSDREHSKMRRFSIALAGAAVVLVAGLVWSGPSQADMWYGPNKNATGKCWYNTNPAPAGLGYWGECKKSTAAATPRKVRHTTHIARR